MSAEEIAAQAREEQSTQRGRRDAEIEAEREDAANALAEELEEMENLEERVRKLREKREALRRGSQSGEVGVALLDAGVRSGAPGAQQMEVIEEDAKEENGDDDDEEEDEDDDDFDEWKFGAA
ncbi:hypothetical protein H2203_008143 [Taxawa tesnikishii (nom. ined.)]|nr:hypothetical protein H2203_008143 [Dothideales sp. JES 119]